jgi:aspartokinase
MSNWIIRFGGSYIGYIDSVRSLIDYLQNKPGRTFVVVSAIPELLEWIEQNSGTDIPFPASYRGAQYKN